LFLIDARAGTFHVHYYGWEDSDDEWVRLSQIREPKVVEYPAGSAVEVIWKRGWYPRKNSSGASSLDRPRRRTSYSRRWRSQAAA